MNIITDWLETGDIIKSGLGNITHEVWMEKHRERIEKVSGREVRISSRFTKLEDGVEVDCNERCLEYVEV
jgi:hypothetical protein